MPEQIIINNTVHPRRRREKVYYTYYYHPRDVVYYDSCGHEVVSSDWRIRDELLADREKRLAMGPPLPMRYAVQERPPMYIEYQSVVERERIEREYVQYVIRR